MHRYRDTVTRSWGPLSCHSSALINSCFSMITHSPVSQGSLHNSLKMKMSQFFHCLHARQTCHPLCMFGMLWIDVYDSVFQFPPISSNFAQSLKRSVATIKYLLKVQYMWPTHSYLYSQSCDIYRLEPACCVYCSVCMSMSTARGCSDDMYDRPSSLNDADTAVRMQLSGFIMLERNSMI